MKALIALAACIAACTLLSAQNPSGQLSGANSQVQPNADGTIGNVRPIIDAPQPGPEVADGSLGGAIHEPDQDGCVTLNPSGGSFISQNWASQWFVHRVVAPRNMTVVSFDFFCRMTTGSATVQTGLFLDSSGKPASSPVRTGSISVSTTSAFRRTTLSSGYYMSKGRVFYIGYKVPNSNFDVAISGGANGTYFWDDSAWKGPFSSYKFAWRVNCFESGILSNYGSSCNTASSRGKGQGPFATGLNVDAVSNDTTGWVTGGRFAHRFVAPRDMYVEGASFLCARTSGATNVTVELYSGTGSSSSPGSLLRTGSMRVGTTSDWYRSEWSPYYFRKGTVFYVVYVAPSNFRVSTDDGVNTTYYYKSPTSSSFSGPFSTRKFAAKLHATYCGAENLSASQDTTSTYVRGATFLHREYAECDEWVSGFGFRCRVASGSSSVRFVMHLQGSDGKPLSGASRTVTRTVTTSNTYYDVHFTPVFVPRGSYYYIGYQVPTSTSVTFYPAVTGTYAYNTPYYWRSGTSGSWSGPFNTKGFARRVYYARTQLNPGTTANGTSTLNYNSYFVLRTVAPDDMWVDSFELFADLDTGSSTITTLLYTANSSGQPSSLVRTGTMAMTTSNTWRRTVFDTPYFFAKGTVFFVGVRTPTSSTGPRMRAVASSGSNASYFYRTASSSSWGGPFSSYPWAYKVHGRTGAARLSLTGDAEIGKTVRINLVGASPSRAYGLVFGASNTSWNGIPLPWSLPFWSGCTLYVSYDLLLTTGSTGSSGNVSIPLGIPNSVPLIGVRFYNQFWVIENFSSFEMSWTNGGYTRVGG